MTSKIGIDPSEMYVGAPIRSYFTNEADSSVQEVVRDYFDRYVTWYNNKDYEAIISSGKVALESLGKKGEPEKRAYILGCLAIASLHKKSFALAEDYAKQASNKLEVNAFHAEVLLCSLEAQIEREVVASRVQNGSYDVMLDRIRIVELYYKDFMSNDPLVNAKIAFYKAFADLQYGKLPWVDCKKSLVTAFSYFKIAQKVDDSISIWCCILLAEGEFSVGEYESCQRWCKEILGGSFSKDQFKRYDALLVGLDSLSTKLFKQLYQWTK